jgi:hypothetical protein
MRAILLKVGIGFTVLWAVITCIVVRSILYREQQQRSPDDKLSDGMRILSIKVVDINYSGDEEDTVANQSLKANWSL